MSVRITQKPAITASTSAGPAVCFSAGRTSVRCCSTSAMTERTVLAARHNLAVSLARDLAGTGVTSNVVSPGAILVDSVRELLTSIAPEHGWGTSWEEIERRAAQELVPNDVGRLGRPEEIAAAVGYLVSPAAAYVSGATIRVEGGAIRSVH
jgi:3-oxoacyl-[acyl-carrier protein] reductase